MNTRLLLMLLIFAVVCGPREGMAHPEDDPAVAVKSASAEQLRPGVEWLDRAHQARLEGNVAQKTSAALRAVSEFAGLVQTYPRDPQPVFMAAQAAALCEDAEKAKAWLQRYEQISPAGEKDPDSHYLRAQVALFASARPDLAVDALREMFKLDPVHRAHSRDHLYYDALLAHGAALVHKGAYDKGIDRFRRAEELARTHGLVQKDRAARGNVAVALRRALRMPEALEVVEKLIAEDPRNVQWRWERGLNEAAQLKYTEAIRSYRQVEKMRKGVDTKSVAARETLQVYLRLGNCLRNSVTARMPAETREARLSEAGRHLEHYVALAPKDARGHRWLGAYWLENREEPHRAIPHFERAHALDPDCATSLRNLVQIYTRHAPQEPGDAAEAAWEAKRLAYAKDLAEGADRRAAAMQARETRLGIGVTGCE
jgi:tetratricopeptide (TPR) repeat protein